MKLLAVLVLPAVLVLGIAYLETQVVSPPPTHAAAKGIVWGGRTFVDRAAFSRWLRSRGVSYRVWARRHPIRTGIALHRKAHRPAQRAAGVSGARHRSGWSLGSLGGAVAVLAVLGLVLVLRRRGGLRRAREGLPGEQLGVAAPRLAGATAGGARLMLRWATVTARTSSSLTRSAALVAWRGRSELAWYVAAALLAAGSAVAVTVWA